MKKLLSFILCCIVLNVAAAVNEKPFTVPAIKEWRGGNGTFNLTQGCKVNVASEQLSQVGKYLTSSLELMQAPKSGNETGVINIQLCKNKKIGHEGYIIKIESKKVTLQANTATGALWGVQTLLQISEKGALPCGVITDTPDYRLRGFMIDVARKFAPMDYLKELVKTMSYYKMNTLQVHLNDNGFKKYFNDSWDQTYAAFRLQSERFPLLTATDGSYSKDEFRQFIKWAEGLGVEVIPEIDMPAHSLAFTKFRPSLKGYIDDHLDITKKETIEFMDSLFIEYLEGPDPVFCGRRVHIGTDEYSNADKAVVEKFRALTDHLIRLVESYGKQAVVWGSLTHAKGDTPVKSENVIMDMWSNGYANPVDMKKLGYQMINICDGYTYIVPAAGYYYEYLNYQFLFQHWTPAVYGSKEELVFTECDPQIEGGMFAIWNDVCGNGISVGDEHHRIFPALQVIAEKTWRAIRPEGTSDEAYAKWDAQRKNISEGPGVDELGNFEATFATLNPKTTLTGKDQPRYQIGYDYRVEFDIEWAKESEGTCLTTSRRAKFYLADPINGAMGYTRDGYFYQLAHTGRPGVKEHIAIEGTNKTTRFYVNGVLIQELKWQKRIAADEKPYNYVQTLVFPLQQTGNFKSKITNFKASHLK